MKIALIGLAPLYDLGISALISQQFPEITVVSASQDSAGNSQYSDHDSQSWRDADSFIVSACAIADNARFFMPRLDRILLLTNSGDYRSSDCEGIIMISPLAPLDALQSALDRLVDTTVRLHPVSTEASLTARETDVLRLTASGLTAKEIAAHLCISVNTVLTHRKNLSSKLGLRTVSALTHYAMVKGILH